MNYKLLIPVFLLLLVGCKGDDELERTVLPFNMEREAEIVEGQSQRQAIFSGNGEYTLSVADESIATAVYRPSGSGIDYGHVVVTGLKRGKTTVTVTDTKAKSSVDVSVRVISSNFYMMSIATSGHPSLKHDLVSCFIPSDKERRDVLFFVQEGAGLRYLTRGTYRTYSEEGADYVVLTYPSTETEGVMTNAADAAMMDHTFALAGSSRDALDILQARGPLTDRFTDPNQLIPVKLVEKGQPFEIAANIKFGPFYTLFIPFGYLE